ncbi:MAG: cation:proton antiporter, partial [Ilumatobacteraceae bacterium]
PVVTIALGLAAAESTSAGADMWVRFAAEQIGFGLGCGVVIGGLGGWWLQRLVDADHVEGIYRQLATVAIIVMAFAAAHELGGNGFIAAFTAGLAFGHTARDHCTAVEDFAEDEGELLSVVTFTVFGAAFAGPALDQLTWPIALYSVLSLTVVRMLPVLVALWGSGTLVETRLFLGWFGPRGLATVLFALLVLQGLDSPRTDTVVAVATWTVLLSIFVHGATASPWVTRLARRLAAMPEHAPEVAPVPELPTRRRGHGG